MTETKDTTDKTLRGGARKPLSLQRTVESGHVRQNFSHGRSKSVVVEKRKTRKLAGPGGTETEVRGRGARRRSASPAQAGAPRAPLRSSTSPRPSARAVSRMRSAMRALAHSPPRASATTSSASRNWIVPSARQLPPLRLRRHRACRRSSCSRAKRRRRRTHRKRVHPHRHVHVPATPVRVRARRTILRCSRAKAASRARSISRRRRAPSRTWKCPSASAARPQVNEEEDSRGGPKGLRKPGARARRPPSRTRSASASS